MSSDIQKLKNTNLELKEIINSSFSGIAIIDFNGKFFYVNESLLPMLGYEKEKFLNSTIIDFVDESQKSKLINFLKKNIQKSSQEDINVLCEKSDGSKIHLKITLTLMLNKKYFVLNAIDITKEILSSDNLSQSTRLEIMSETISTLSKEWEKPLGTITELSSTLDNDFKGNEKIEKLLGKINSCVGELSESMDEFKDLVDIKGNVEDVDLKNLISTLIKPYGRQSNFKILCRKDIVIKTYPTRLVEVFNNIIQNAIESMRRNLIEHNKNILIELTADDNEVLIIITDTAGGIEPKDLPLIFNAGFSTKDGNDLKKGYGLYTSKNIVQMHLKGSIDIKSKLNKTSVTIKLPLEI